MKVLHISRRFFPCIGGTENYIYEISKRLIQRNINCRVLTLDYDVLDRKQKFKSYEKIFDIEVFRIPGFGYNKKPIPLGIPLALFKWADIIHTHDVRLFYETSIFLKPFFNYKIIFSTHGFILHTDDLKLAKHILVPIYYKNTIKHLVDWIICDSKQDYDYFTRTHFRRVSLIENGIDFEKFSKVKINADKDLFLYFGRIDKNKGLDLLFKILSCLSSNNWQLHILGNGNENIIKSLKRTAIKLGICNKIVWHGFVEESTLIEFLSKAHLCFFPSIYEGFGFTLIEAMACGHLCIANSIAPFTNVLRDNENGFLADFANHQETSKKIKDILNKDESCLCNIRYAAKQTASKYEWSKKISDIINIYEGQIV